MNIKRPALLTILLPVLSSAALAGGGTQEARMVVLGLRLPRLLLGIGVGAALALAGAALQSLLGNPLADPFLLGISGGGAAVSVKFEKKARFHKVSGFFRGVNIYSINSSSSTKRSPALSL